jgi:hypothetical protein
VTGVHGAGLVIGSKAALPRGERAMARALCMSPCVSKDSTAVVSVCSARR